MRDTMTRPAPSPSPTMPFSTRAQTIPGLGSPFVNRRSTGPSVATTSLPLD